MATSLIGKKIGNYNITQLLGEGGMGAVYLGEHPLIGKKVAVKLLHDDLALKEDIVQRFFTEAKAVNDIHHENIVDIVDFGKTRDEQTGHELVYFLMEYLEGESLSARLKRAPIGPTEAVHIVDQCAGALAASHSKNIVHRDIKPDNVILITRGHDQCFVKLLDFGIAKLTSAGSSAVTRTGSVLGTPAYMSPEQCDGRGNIDFRSDIYSLGVVLYELLCGQVPFGGDGFGEVLVAHLTAPILPPSRVNASVPAGLEQIVMHCLEKSRDMRFQSMDELRTALQSSGSYVAPRPLTGPVMKVDPSAVAPTMMGQRPTTLSGSAGEVAPASGQRSKVGLFAAFGAAAVAAGVAAFLLTRKHEVEPLPMPVVIHKDNVAPPPVDEMVHVVVDSTPEGAAIKRAGRIEPIGKTPFEMKIKRGSPAFDLVLSLDGYRDENRTIETLRDHDMLIALAKIEAPVPPTTPVKPEKHGPRKQQHDSGLRLLPDHPSHSSDPDGVLAPKL